MSSFDRSLAGSSPLDLAHEIAQARAGHATRGAGRTARTLLKDGPLRVTLIVLQAGARIAEHSADGPITVHVLEGTIRMVIGGVEHRISAGQLIGAGAGVRHDVAAEEDDAVFLLTVALPTAAT